VNFRHTEQENLAEDDYANLTPLTAESAQHTSAEPQLGTEKSCDLVFMAWETLGGKISVENVGNVRQRNNAARENNHCYQTDATMPSIVTVVELRLSTI
jgi:hypothetical protein